MVGKHTAGLVVAAFHQKHTYMTRRIEYCSGAQPSCTAHECLNPSPSKVPDMALQSLLACSVYLKTS